MLPGLRLVLAAITATILLLVLGFVQLVKLHVAQDHSSNLAPVEARFAGLAFAARADWTPVPAFRSRSLESLPPFANMLPLRLPPDQDTPEPEVPAQLIVLIRTNPEPPQPAEEREPPSATDVGTAVALEPTVSASAAMPELDMATIAASAEPIAAEPTLAADTLLPAAMPTTVVAILTAEGVPLPAPRPDNALPPTGKAQPGLAKKKAAQVIARNRAAPGRPPAQPPPSSAPTNPFAALFGN